MVALETVPQDCSSPEYWSRSHGSCQVTEADSGHFSAQVHVWSTISVRLDLKAADAPPLCTLQPQALQPGAEWHEHLNDAAVKLNTECCLAKLRVSEQTWSRSIAARTLRVWSEATALLQPQLSPTTPAHVARPPLPYSPLLPSLTKLVSSPTRKPAAPGPSTAEEEGKLTKPAGV